MRIYQSYDASRLPLEDHTSVTIIALGRGVNLDGSLTRQQRFRVRETLRVAADLQTRGVQVQIIWTGRASRKQISKGTLPKVTEARAMFTFGQNLPESITIDQVIEAKSTNTVENMIYSYPDVLPDSLIVVLTDDLHHKWGRVALITRLHFPKRAVCYVTIGNTQGNSLKGELTQIASLIALVLTMIGVKRGNPDAVKQRQDILNRIFMRRQPTS